MGRSSSGKTTAHSVVRVREAHESVYPHPISFTRGDEVTVTAVDDDFPGWIWSRTVSGREGWAPLAWLERIAGSDRARALRDYSARELDTEVGELLTVLEEESQWLRARRADGEVGWVPASTVESSAG